MIETPKALAALIEARHSVCPLEHRGAFTVNCDGERQNFLTYAFIGELEEALDEVYLAFTTNFPPGGLLHWRIKPAAEQVGATRWRVRMRLIVDYPKDVTVIPSLAKQEGEPAMAKMKKAAAAVPVAPKGKAKKAKKAKAKKAKR